MISLSTLQLHRHRYSLSKSIEFVNYINDFKCLVVRSCLLIGQIPCFSVSFSSFSLCWWSRVQWYSRWSVVWSVVQRVSRGIALLFHDRGTRRGWVVSSTPRPHFTFGKDPVPILQEAEWAPGPVWTGEISRPPPGLDPRTVQPVAQPLYRLSYPAHR